MSSAIGSLRGLDACASARGCFGVLALDHRQNLRKELAPDDPASISYRQMVAFKRAVVRAIGEHATGVLLDPEIGVAQTIADGSLPARAGLIVALEATGFEGPPTARRSRMLPGWSVEQAARTGADAAKLLLYYHPDASTAGAQERLLAEVAAACRGQDLPLFVEPLGYGLTDDAPKLTGDERRRVVVETARRLGAIGGDVLKLEFPYEAAVTDRERWAEACAEVDAASPVPWVILSGGVDDATFEAQAETACQAGASGVLAGRSVWAGSARLAAAERDAWLESRGRASLARLIGIVDRWGRPWRTRSPLARQEPPGEGWYLADAPRVDA